MTTETQPSDNTINCPRCGHAFNNVDQRFNCTQIVCPDCATGFTWENYPKPDLAIPFTELDKLPVGTLLIGNDGGYWEKWDTHQWDYYQHLPSAEISEEDGPFRYVTTL